MKADQAYPPVVGVAVMRSKYGIGNEEAEKRLREDPTTKIQDPEKLQAPNKSQIPSSKI